jgi:glycosyltransferase involved in cell wall biosynthesis
MAEEIIVSHDDDSYMNAIGAAEAPHIGSTPGPTRVPRLSLGLPVYNGDRYLDGCIASIVSQSYSDIELCICDNASTDSTAEIAQAWCARDPRIRYYRADHNRGAARNFNWTLELARGELFKWCAVDDVLAPGMLSRCVEALDQNPDAVLAYTGAVDIDPQGSVLGEIYDNRSPLRFDSKDVSARFHDLALTGHSCISVFGIIRSASLRKTAVIGPYPGSDHALLVELGLGGRFVRVHENLLLHRQHPERSVTQFPKLRDRARWFSGRSHRFVFANFRLFGAYALTMLRTRMPIRSRIRCFASLLRWLHWGGWRKLAGDLVDELR